MRKKLFVIPHFQLSFVLFNAFNAVIFGIGFYIAHRVFFYKFLVKGRMLGIPYDHEYFHFISEQQSVMGLIFLLMCTIIIVFVIIYGIYLSNRIAGPIYRIQQYLSQLNHGGQYKEIRFREKDYFHELAGIVNEYVKKNLEK